jgi:hypothetical protein
MKLNSLNNKINGKWNFFWVKEGDIMHKRVLWPSLILMEAEVIGWSGEL